VKAITVRQPWAWAIIHAGKDVENRSRNVAGDYRGPLAIHSSGRKSDDPQYVRDAVDRMADRGLPRKDDITDLSTFIGDGSPLLVGCVLGVADLIAVHTFHECQTYRGGGVTQCCSPWGDALDMDGRYMWHLVLANPRPLRLPLQIPGHLGLWELPDHLLNGRW